MLKEINPVLIKNSFTESGIYDPMLQGYNINQCMNKFKVDFNDYERFDFVEAIPKLAKKLGEKGELTEKDYDLARLPKTDNKDDKVLNRRRFVILSSINVTQRIQEEIIEKEERMNKKNEAKLRRQSSATTKQVRKKRAKVELHEDDSSDNDSDE
jgi:hypothetical protein